MSSNSNEWSTPSDFFYKLDKEFRFSLDPCSTHGNAKCQKHFTKQEDGLIQDWSNDVVFMNPPYGREIGKWVKKAYEEYRKGATVVCLIPARTDTAYFHDYIFPNCEIRFIRGRLKFGNLNSPAPFPSMLAIFWGRK
jgi:phage N-6-adenine-methyltransferase